MNLLAVVPLVVGQFSKWKRMGDGFRQVGSRAEFADLLPYLLTALVVGIALWVVYYKRRKRDLDSHCNDPEKLFRELSLAHRLDAASQKLLWQLAQACQLSQPAEVFVTPRLFSRENLPEHLRAESERIAELRRRLF